jgi:hypothetical protein
MKITLTNEEVAKIRTQSQARGVLNSRSLTGGKGNLVGKAAERMFGKLFPTAQYVDSRAFDYVLNGRKIEVKARGSDREPKSYWDCKIPCYSFHQQACDIYAFFSVKLDGQTGVFLGWLTKAEVAAKATLIKKGTVATSGGIVHEDHYIVLVSDLHPPQSLR